MNMKNIFLFIIFCSTLLYSKQDSVETRGRYLPSIGEINVLFIFAQFPDDRLEPDNPIWPKGSEPAKMKRWVDQKWNRNPTPGSMTHFFNEMSFNKLKFIGKSVSAISPHSRKWYLDNKKRRGFIHREVIKEVNKKMNFTQFDNWSLQGEYKHKNKPDGIIDMIFMVWRNISNDYPSDSVKLIQSLLEFNNDEGDLGGTTFNVDNGKRTVKTWWGISGNQPGGSGVTVRDYLTTNALRTCIHEFAHYLIGNNSYHTGYGFWGMLDAWGKKTQVANSFERSLLGWIKIKSINNSDAKTFKDIKLRDYVTTGDAVRITIDSLKDEYFYVENHQNISYWENNHVFGNVEKGIYVIRQDSYYGGSLQLISASGRYYWMVNQEIKNPWGSGMLPVYDPVRADRKYGHTDLEYIPWEWKGKKMSPAPVHFTQDKISTLPVKDVKYQGDGRDAFRMGYNEVFSPWSNPDSQNKNRDSTGIGFKLDGDTNGVYTLDIYIHTAYEAPPSKPINLKVKKTNGSVLITWSENIEPDMKNGFYKIYKAEDKNGEPGIFKLVKKIEAFERNGNAVTEWNDLVQNKKYFYRISAVDNTGQESVPTDFQPFD